MLGIAPGFLPKFAERVREVMGRAYPELIEQREVIDKWLAGRGGGLRPHARAGHAAARRPRRPRQGDGRRGHLRRGRLPPARHLRVPHRPDEGPARRARPGGGRERLRGPDGRAARPRPQRGSGRDRDGARPRPRAGLRGRRRVRHRLPGLRDPRDDDELHNALLKKYCDQFFKTKRPPGSSAVRYESSTRNGREFRCRIPLPD